MENKLILYHEKLLQDLLSDNNLLIKIRAEMRTNGHTDLDKDFCMNDRTALLKEIIALKTGELLKIFSDIDSRRMKKFLDEIRNTWKNFVQKIKLNTKKKISTLPKFPFYSDNQNNVKLEKILTPLQVRICRDQDILREHDIIDEIQLLPKLKKSNRILIHGDAGIGKSFHCKSILHKWTENKILNDYLVLRIELIDVVSGKSLIETIIDQNLTESMKDEENLLKYFMSDKCEYKYRKIILLLDGADEFLVEQSEIKNIINKSSHVQHPIIVWTRPINIKKIEETYDIVLEIMGFNSIQKEKFFDKLLPKKTGIESEGYKLFSYLIREKSEIFKSCSNPLFAALTVYIWKQSKDVESLTEIIEKAIEILLKKSKIIGKEGNLDEIILPLGRQALEFILNKKVMTLDRKEYPNDLGGLINFKDDCKKDGKTEFRFLHYLFHEYCAAKFIVSDLNKLPDDKSIQRIPNIFGVNNPIHFKKILEFVNEMDQKLYQIILQIQPHLIVFMENVTDEIYEYVKAESLTKIILQDLRIHPIIINMLFSKHVCTLKEIALENVIIDFLQILMCFKRVLQNNITTLKVKSRDKISLFNDQTDVGLVYLFKVLPKLEKLTLINYSLKNQQFNNFTNYPRNLKSITLKNCELNDDFPIEFHGFYYINLSKSKLSGKVLNFSLVFCKKKIIFLFNINVL